MKKSSKLLDIIESTDKIPFATVESRNLLVLDTTMDAKKFINKYDLVKRNNAITNKSSNSDKNAYIYFKTYVGLTLAISRLTKLGVLSGQ